MLLRLLTAAALLCATQAFTQVQPGDPSDATSTLDQLQANPYLRLNLDQPNSSPENSTKTLGQPSRGLSGLLDLKQTPMRAVGEMPWQAEATCFAIRSYRVVRDDPHSHSIHRDGYTTCVPSARFRVYTADEKR
jgi:hypothetical protein